MDAFCRRRIALPLVTLASCFAIVSGYSFNIDNNPQQCSNLSLSITGSGGTPPYNALILPFGGSPLPNNVEARRILATTFSGNSASVQLKYPENSQFVVVVSDSQTFGSGGTSAAAIVTSSSDSSCFDSSTSVQPDFVYSIFPADTIVQCQSTRIFWTPSDVQGTPNFYAVIPGGQSFSIPPAPVSSLPSQGDGFNWTANVRAGTTLLLGAGDNRGLNSGGSATFIVQAGQFPSGSCLNDTSPSSTPGSPAGGNYPTSTSGAGTGGSGGGGGTNIGAIVGGVVGGVVGLIALLLLLLFWRRRSRFHEQQKAMKERPDLFNDDERPGDGHTGVPAHLQPEPFIIPPQEGSEHGARTSIADGGAAGLLSSEGRSTNRVSSVSGSNSRSTSFEMNRPFSPGTSVTQATSSGYTRKSAPPTAMRPVNIIQHDDAGVAGEGGEEEDAETVELPPAYTNIKRGGGATS